MKLLLAYRAYKQMIAAPCHNKLYPILGDFYVTKATYCIIKKVENERRLPEFVSIAPDSTLHNNLGEMEYIDSMPNEYVRVYLTDEEKYKHQSGTIRKTVWECFDSLMSAYDKIPTNHMCKNRTIHNTCLNNLIKSLARGACANCPSLSDIKYRLNVV